MSVLLRVAELNAAYAATIDTDRLESWPDFFVEDCLYKTLRPITTSAA
jgi:3-phenylpropionate/cinnamic acid dioxygenase small subunit